MPRSPFWKWVFCEPDGTPSMSRVATGVLIGFACGWVTAIVHWTHALPELSGLAAFITVLYGTNRISTMFKDK